MRTKGKLLWGKYGKIMPQNRPDAWGHPLSLSGVALASGGPDEEADDNSKHLLACWNAIESIGGDPESVGDLREALFEAVKSLAHVRDFVGTLISDKHLKWQTYVDLTDAMKIPDINQLLARTKVEL